MNKLIALSAVALALSVQPAHACWDNTDEILAELQELELTTEQLKAIYALRDEHKAVIARAHSENLGCRHHEEHEVEFKKASIGVLSDAQFKSYLGRERNENEQLTYEIYLLKCEIQKLQTELAKYKPVEAKSGCCGSKAAPEKKASCGDKADSACGEKADSCCGAKSCEEAAKKDSCCPEEEEDSCCPSEKKASN